MTSVNLIKKGKIYKPPVKPAKGGFFKLKLGLERRHRVMVSVASTGEDKL